MLNINGIEWHIVYCNPNSNYLKKSDGTSVLGATDLSSKCIYINNKLGNYLMNKVICHEIVHAFCFSYNCNFDVETEEVIADFVATYGRSIFEVADDVILRIVRRVS